ncbi:WD40-repeat-containing domain protein [Tribonema minus]|uniref:WD40-repeat-containing domain protein n=1 Tax=Tribonema minus TaxID=303371 RepID=A0A835YJ38_9STRA|nr:WD40-repeat-containing domain protein [Tribonema minus]
MDLTTLGAPPGPVAQLRGHTAGIQSVQYLSSDVLLSGSEDGEVRVWQLKRRRPLAVLSANPSGGGHQHGILRIDCTAIQINRTLIQSRDGTIAIWDSERLASGDTGAGRCGRISTGAHHFCQIALPRWPSADSSSSSSSGGGGAATAALPQQCVLAPCEEQSRLQLWDLRAQAPQLSIDAPADAADGTKSAGMVMCCRLLGGGARPLAAAGYEDGSLACFDLRAAAASSSSSSGSSSGRALVARAKLHDEPLMCFDIAPNMAAGASASAGALVRVFSLDLQGSSCKGGGDSGVGGGGSGGDDNSGAIAVRSTFELATPGMACVESRGDGALFACGGWDARVRLYRWARPAPLAVLACHEDTVASIAFHPDAAATGEFAAGSRDCRISIWRMYGG